MKGYSPKLPLMTDPRDGYRLNRTLTEVVKQNLKMIVLTSPGERIMDTNFGVGIYNFIFEMDSERTRANLSSRINTQIAKYLPSVQIIDIKLSGDPKFDPDHNVLSLVIEYAIPSLGHVDLLRINID
tara:strand:+ start:163 stop:543 length:381 start_codon:yes stop_codon:yes gene_type:complete